LHQFGDFIVAIAQKKTIRTSVLLPEGAYTRVQALAEINDVSTAWVIRHAINEFLNEHEDQIELPLSLPKAGREKR
jgi:predicted transcriptional regulator